MEYSRALPEVTFQDMEEAFRSDPNFRVHLIAMVCLQCPYSIAAVTWLTGI